MNPLNIHKEQKIPLERKIHHTAPGPPYTHTTKSPSYTNDSVLWRLFVGSIEMEDWGLSFLHELRTGR